MNDDAEFKKLEESIKQMLEDNKRLAQVCQTQRSMIQVLVQQRDAAMDFQRAMEAMKKP